MKPTLFILLSVLAACCCDRSTHPVSFNTTQPVYLSTTQPIYLSTTQSLNISVSNTIQTISYDSVPDLIYNFLSQKDLKPYGTKLAIGGFIDSSVISKFMASNPSAAGKYTVLDFFLCHRWDGPDTSKGKFYLALKEEKDYVPGTSVPTGPADADSLYVTTDMIPYTESVISVSQIKTFLERTVTITNDRAPKVVGKTVKTDAYDFLKSYTVSGISANYDMASVMVKDTILKLLNQRDPDNIGLKLSRMRYFLGYSSSYGHNKIRLILIAVNKQGKNQVANKAVLLEHAWPPDASY